jgi:hypothetical protein
MIDRSVLVLAPASELKNVAEIVAAANGMRVTVLDGLVSGREMLREIASGRHQVVFFAGHGDDSYLMMSDGRLADEYLRQALSNASVEIVVLNSCRSISAAAALYRAGVAPRVVGWPDVMSDAGAVAWARAFFRSLALGADYWEAYASAVELLRAQFAEDRPPELLNGRISLLETRVAAIQADLESMRGQVVVPRWTVGLLLLAANSGGGRESEKRI